MVDSLLATMNTLLLEILEDPADFYYIQPKHVVRCWVSDNRLFIKEPTNANPLSLKLKPNMEVASKSVCELIQHIGSL